MDVKYVNKEQSHSPRGRGVFHVEERSSHPELTWFGMANEEAALFAELSYEELARLGKAVLLEMNRHRELAGNKPNGGVISSKLAQATADTIDNWEAELA